jgi:hypothetical protein
MLIYEIPGQFRIVYVHDHREGPQAFCGNATQGVERIGQTLPTYEEAETVVTPIYVQYRSPTWRHTLSWDHVPMTLELFEAFIRAEDDGYAILESSGRRAGIRSELMATLMGAPKEEIEQKLAQAIAAAAALAPWKEAHKESPEPGRVVWACVYDDITDSPQYEVTQLAYSGDAWFHECGALAVAPDYFAEMDSAPAEGQAESMSAPMPPPVRVFPWRPWV